MNRSEGWKDFEGLFFNRFVWWGGLHLSSLGLSRKRKALFFDFLFKCLIFPLQVGQEPICSIFLKKIEFTNESNKESKLVVEVVVYNKFWEYKDKIKKTILTFKEELEDLEVSELRFTSGFEE